MSALVAQSSLNVIQSGTVLLAVHGGLFGYFLTEVGIYFVRFPNDRVGFRCLVYWLTIVQIVYMAVKIGNYVTIIDRALNNRNIDGNGLWLTFSPVLLTVLMEATAEGFFCWRLCAVSNKPWMKSVACLLWSFSTISHIIWVAMLGTARQAGGPDPPRLRVMLMCSFWGTAAENIWISSCLIYELAFSRDRKALKGSNNGSISKLVSLAMRTSAILIVFELMVAILVSVGNQNPTTLNIETSFATAIYTVLTSIVVLHTLNYRTKIRNASPTFSSPVFFAPTKSVSSGSGARSNDPSLSPSQPISGGKRSIELSEREGEGEESSNSGSQGKWRGSMIKEKMREREKKKERQREASNGEGSGTGITVQTVSWVMEERVDTVEGGKEKARSENEMVIERGKKDTPTKPHRLRNEMPKLGLYQS